MDFIYTLIEMGNICSQFHNNIPVVPTLTDYASSENSGVGSNSPGIADF